MLLEVRLVGTPEEGRGNWGVDEGADLAWFLDLILVIQAHSLWERPSSLTLMIPACM